MARVTIPQSPLSQLIGQSKPVNRPRQTGIPQAPTYNTAPVAPTQQQQQQWQQQAQTGAGLTYDAPILGFQQQQQDVRMQTENALNQLRDLFTEKSNLLPGQENVRGLYHSGIMADAIAKLASDYRKDTSQLQSQSMNTLQDLTQQIGLAQQNKGAYANQLASQYQKDWTDQAIQERNYRNQLNQQSFENMMNVYNTKEDKNRWEQQFDFEKNKFNWQKTQQEKEFDYSKWWNTILQDRWQQEQATQKEQFGQEFGLRKQGQEFDQSLALQQLASGGGGRGGGRSGSGGGGSIPFWGTNRSAESLYKEGKEADRSNAYQILRREIYAAPKNAVGRLNTLKGSEAYRVLSNTEKDAIESLALGRNRYLANKRKKGSNKSLQQRTNEAINNLL